jgi:hypothetical protein
MSRRPVVFRGSRVAHSSFMGCRCASRLRVRGLGRGWRSVRAPTRGPRAPMEGPMARRSRESPARGARRRQGANARTRARGIVRVPGERVGDAAARDTTVTLERPELATGRRVRMGARVSARGAPRLARPLHPEQRRGTRTPSPHSHWRAAHPPKRIPRRRTKKTRCAPPKRSLLTFCPLRAFDSNAPRRAAEFFSGPRPATLCPSMT